jgi:hypothetical protein
VLAAHFHPFARNAPERLRSVEVLEFGFDGEAKLLRPNPGEECEHQRIARGRRSPVTLLVVGSQLLEKC